MSYLLRVCRRTSLLLLVALAFGVIGCDARAEREAAVQAQKAREAERVVAVQAQKARESTNQQEGVRHAEKSGTQNKNTADEQAKTTDRPDAKRVPMGKNVWLEVDGERRRVLIQAEVCLREGLLEQLMCRRQTKEHEAILAADVDARNIHKALLLTGAMPGSTVQYQPQFKVPSGTRIKVTLQYDKDGKTVQVPAQQWVADTKAHKDLAFDWVFAGSHLYENPLDKNAPPAYAANSGDVICVSNFETAMLDLPINSSNDNTELEFEANTKRIPPVGTKVLVILEPLSRGS